MPGERLMCVWQAIFARDVFPESGVKKATVKSVTESFASNPFVTYQESRFEEIFTMSKVDFGFYVDYLKADLRAVSSPINLFCESLEELCWEIVEEAEIYKSDHLGQEYLKKLWHMFNRISYAGSYPPTAHRSEVNWLFEKVAKNLGKTWVSHDSIPAGGVTFQGFYELLDRTFFAAAQPVLLQQCIEEMNCLLVKEVLKMGYLHKRTRKQANWTNWLKRFFVLTPKSMVYYTSEKCRNKKGEFVIDSKTKVEQLPDFSSLTKKLTCRYKVSNKPDLEIELCAISELDKQQWIGSLNEAIKSANTGLTPIAQFLQSRAKKLSLHRVESAEKVDAEMNQEIVEKQELARKASKKIPAATPASKPSRPPKLESLSEGSQEEMNGTNGRVSPVSDDTEVYDNNAMEVQKEKIKAVFFQIDKNGNGKIERDEFFEFMHGLGVMIPRSETDLIFESIDQDGNNFLCFQEFYDYMVRCVQGSGVENSMEAKLRTAFLAADRDGSGHVSFREFAEFAFQQKSNFTLNDILEAFEKMDIDKSGEISYREFKEFFSRQSRQSMAQVGMLSPSADGPNLEDKLRSVYDKSDAQEMAAFLKDRWTKFASFKRVGADGNLVMKGASGMVADCVPGEYSLIDLACFTDLPPIRPKTTVVHGVQWQSSSVPGRSGRLTFPNNFDGKIATSIATNETLAYYGCSLADSNQLKVSLLYRHGIQDFTYENNYLEEYVLAEKALGGAGLEKHAFAHLDCPLDEESGFFMLAKFEGSELHMTGFKIPTRHTLYVPPMTIHCNDYLKGTWRTMLSDEADVDHVQLVRSRREGKVETLEHFRFEFNPLM